MNILVLSWRDPKHPLAGGAEQVMHEHMEGWVKKGHKVTLFASSFRGNNLKKEVLDGIQILRRGNQLFGVHVLALFWYLRKGKRNKYDLVVDQFHGIPFFAPIYAKTRVMAVLQEVAGSVWFKNDLPFPFNYIIGLVGFVFEPFIFLLYRKIPFMVGSNSAKEDLIKMGLKPDSITIIPHGVIIPKILPNNEKPKTKTITYLGALAKDKGVEDAIRSFAFLNKKGKYNFWIVGRGGRRYQLKLQELVNKLGLKVKFWGYVDEDKKFEILRKSHLLVNPSIREGWGLVNIEANAMGTPVIAYKSPGLVDSVNNGVSGLFVAENTPQAIADTILRILSDEKKYNKIQTSSINWSRNFNWEKSRKLSLSLIDRVVNSEYI